MPLDPTTLALIDQALEEDLRDVGDLTSLYFVPEEAVSSGRIVSREDAVLAGVEVAEEVFHKVDPKTKVTCVRQSGDAIKPGEVAIEISGRSRSILSAERIALNFLQRLSGVATLTRSFVDAAGNHKARILDTRKTTPGWRLLEKRAVVDGGGKNHRMGLYDMVMVKDNHLKAEGSPEAIQRAVDKIKSEREGISVELEVDTLEQLADFLKLDGIDFILLDNMGSDKLREAVAMNEAAGGKVELEASGGVNLETVGGIAASGVDFISVGALTHSARSIDLSLEFDED
ncbi:MAG: nicotinate-nucleotide pyrophosphorylase (carboxylating) [Verrucomicrobiales bacterium]|jgi:nicotinate-nucleotide pyrophosphorylase (carboxylating)